MNKVVWINEMVLVHCTYNSGFKLYKLSEIGIYEKDKVR
jgi:hypothetical protein